MKNRSTRRCSFEVVYTTLPGLTFDLANLPSNVDISVEVEDMVERIESLPKEVHDHLQKTFVSYKEDKDKARREVEFKGDCHVSRKED